MMYQNLATKEGRSWLHAHEATRRDAAKSEMPRALLEREVAEWMLADKEAHAGHDLGARPRELPFEKFTHWNAPAEPPCRPWRDLAAVTERAAAHARSEAEKCERLFLAVVNQLALDLERSWGVTETDRRESVMFFSGRDSQSTIWREELAALARLEPETLVDAFDAGRLRDLSKDAIGKRRYETRRRNAGRKTIDQLKPGQQMELAL